MGCLPRKVSLLLLFLVGTACSTAAEPVDLGNFCDRWTRIVCDAARDCDCLGDFGMGYCHVATENTCREEVLDPVKGGLFNFDDLEAARCLTGMRSAVADCSYSLAEYPDPCWRMLVPDLVEGQECDEDRQCTGGLSCLGVCMTLPTDSQACVDFLHCAEGHFCGNEGFCHLLRGADESCAQEGQRACAPHHFCDWELATCQPFLDPGADCSRYNSICGEGLYCSPSDRTCKPIPGEGEPCSDSHSLCAEGLFCDEGILCEARFPEGAECTFDGQCESESCLDESCAPPMEVCGMF